MKNFETKIKIIYFQNIIRTFSEILQHQHFCRNFTKLFKGRDELLDQIKTYIKTDERHQPFAMNGPSGCGKSSIIAKTAIMV